MLSRQAALSAVAGAPNPPDSAANSRLRPRYLANFKDEIYHGVVDNHVPSPSDSQFLQVITSTHPVELDRRAVALVTCALGRRDRVLVGHFDHIVHVADQYQRAPRIDRQRLAAAVAKDQMHRQAVIP